MKLIALSMDVWRAHERNERRDTVDQRLVDFLRQSGLMPVLVPNHLTAAKELLERIDVCGLVLAGGNDIGAYGGDVPERDETECRLVEWATDNGHPILGICRGMQLIQHLFGVPLARVEGHVSSSLDITVNGRRRITNSYHRWGAFSTVAELEIWAKADDGVIKAIRHSRLPILGIMWHPERNHPFAKEDIDLFARHLRAEHV